MQSLQREHEERNNRNLRGAKGQQQVAGFKNNGQQRRRIDFNAGTGKAKCLPGLGAQQHDAASYVGCFLMQQAACTRGCQLILSSSLHLLYQYKETFHKLRSCLGTT